jgi:hypothetical protein
MIAVIVLSSLSSTSAVCVEIDARWPAKCLAMSPAGMKNGRTADASRTHQNFSCLRLASS